MKCAVSTCVREKYRAHTLCTAHLSRRQRTGDVRADIPIGQPLKSRWNPADPVSYTVAHGRAKYVRGKASEHPCVDCGGSAQEWSYRGGSAFEQSGPRSVRGREFVQRWSGDPADYDPRCVPCHRRFDSGHHHKEGLR